MLDKLGDRLLEVDVVLPQRVIGVNQQRLRWTFGHWDLLIRLSHPASIGAADARYPNHRLSVTLTITPGTR